MYDDKGDRITTRAGAFIPRPPGTPLPCNTCPKKSPEEAHEYELNDRNQTLAEYYLTARGCGWNSPMDDLTRERFGVVDVIIRECEQKATAENLAASLAPIMLRRHVH